MPRKTKKSIYENGKKIAENMSKICNESPNACAEITSSKSCETIYKESPKQQAICNCGVENVIHPDLEYRSCEKIRKYIEKQGKGK